LFCVFLRSGFRVVLSVAISTWKLCSVRLNLLLFVGGQMSYLRYLSLLSYSGIQQILHCVDFFFFVLCTYPTLCCQFLWIINFWLPLRNSLTFMCPVPYVASFSGLSIFDCPFVFLSRLFRNVSVPTDIEISLRW